MPDGDTAPAPPRRLPLRLPAGLGLAAMAGAPLVPSPLGAAVSGAAGVCLLGATAYRRLAGNWPLASPLDEWRLRRTPWDQLADLHRRNPRRSPLVVCLTTIPSRLDPLELTLKTLLRQSVRPAEIRLHLPEYSRREERPYSPPAWLCDTDCVTLVRCEDHGPATKLIPALDLDPRQPFLVLDDDRVYGPRLVEEMDAAWRALPDAIPCGSGWSAPEDLVDRPTTLWRVLRRAPHVPIFGTNVTRPVPVDILQGLQSYLAQPRFFDREALLDYADAPPEARWCDDVWISAHARAPRVVVPLSRVSHPHWWGRSRILAHSLARNFNYKPDPEARSNTVLLQHFRDRWAVSRSPDPTP